jgi:hypothetical protein
MRNDLRAQIASVEVNIVMSFEVVRPQMAVITEECCSTLSSCTSSRLLFDVRDCV